jgi:hypothetical protein
LDRGLGWDDQVLFTIPIIKVPIITRIQSKKKSNDLQKSSSSEHSHKTNKKLPGSSITIKSILIKTHQKKKLSTNNKEAPLNT